MIVVIILTSGMPALRTDLAAQTGFRETFKAADPVPGSLELSVWEEISIHQRYLDSSRAAGDSSGVFFSNLYLLLDHVKLENYAAATLFLLQAESVAGNAGDESWLGAVSYYRGYLNLTLRNLDEALAAYLRAVSSCRTVGDSLCLAESLEQVSAIYGRQRKFKEARGYLDEALPLIERWGTGDHLGIAYNNYGTLLFMEEDYDKALVYTQRSIDLHRKTDRIASLAKAMHNLANIKRRKGELNEAIAGLEECVAFNRKHGFRDNIIQNYSALRLAHYRKGNYQTAYQYLSRYIALKDSINGEETDRKIADLTIRYANTRSELALEKNKVSLAAAELRLNRGYFLLACLLLFVIWGAIAWMRQHRRSRMKLAESTKNLASLTRLLIEKKHGDQRESAPRRAGGTGCGGG